MGAIKLSGQMRIRLNLYSNLLLGFGVLLLLASCRGPLEVHSRTALATGNTEPIVQSLLTIMGLTSNTSQATRLRFCDTLPNETTCTGPAPSGKSRDMGLFPVSLSIQSAEIVDLRQIDNGWQAKARLRPLVNGITPWCYAGDLKITVDNDGRIKSSIDSTYCNWLLLGNFTVKFSFSVEEFDVDSRTLAGFYTMHFVGTSRADVSGYLLAAVE